MDCPRCLSKAIVKNGRRRNKQNYLCRNCGRQFVERKSGKSQGYCKIG